jgi:hypothetical protein
MKLVLTMLVIGIALIMIFSCNNEVDKANSTMTIDKKELTAKDILGNPEYLCMSYGGYRYVDHDIEPTIDELKEDVKILFAMGVRIVRTYKVHLPQASNLLKAISEALMKDVLVPPTSQEIKDRENK